MIVESSSIEYMQNIGRVTLSQAVLCHSVTIILGPTIALPVSQRWTFSASSSKGSDESGVLCVTKSVIFARPGGRVSPGDLCSAIEKSLGFF